MTRDEAIRKFNDAADGSFSGEAWIDRFVALGILKLDEPRSNIDLLVESLGWRLGSCAHAELNQALGRAGLMIVKR